ncbi:MAG: hypothetical protein R3E96_02915 [Planctomycetota bacterium]
MAYDIGAINNDLTLSLCAGNTKLSGTSIPVLEHTDDTIDRDGATIHHHDGIPGGVHRVR